MKALLQRVAKAAVHLDGSPISAINRGLVILLGVEQDDSDATLETLLNKVAGLRIFDDETGRMNLSIGQVEGEFLVVSQFTLCADLTRGRRPGFENAMKPPGSERLYDLFCRRLAESTGRPVKTGRFGASMVVEIHNSGPATFWVTS